MTSLHSKDRDLHHPDGSHYKKPPRNAADPDAFAGRLRRHLLAHELDPGMLGSSPRERKRQRRPTIDPWLAEKLEQVNALGPKVRELLRTQGQSQQVFADELGLSLSSLVDRLSGRQSFDLAEGLFLEEYFGVSLTELLKPS